MSEVATTEPPRRPKWVHTLSGPWSTETYGVVQFLRSHPWARRVVAICGVAFCVLAIAWWGGLRIPGLTLSFLPFMIIGPWFLFVATISGPDFEVTFPSRQAAEDRQKAEKQYEQSRSVDDALRLDLSRLNEYYVINQSQARSSFRWAVAAMLLGFGTIVAGVWLFYFRTNQPDTFMASLSTAAGLVVNVVSAMFLYLHGKIQDRSLHYYEQLSRLQHVSIAIRLAEAHSDTGAQQEARNLIIRQLISHLQPQLPTTRGKGEGVSL